MQASVDAAQDKMIEDMKEELSQRMDALQKEMKKVKIASGGQQAPFGTALSQQISQQFLAVSNSGQLRNSGATVDVTAKLE